MRVILAVIITTIGITFAVQVATGFVSTMHHVQERMDHALRQ